MDLKEFHSPFYTLDTSFEKERSLIFANISLPETARYTMLPSIINNSEFQTSIYALLTTTHDVVKERLKEMRSNGNALAPKQSPNVDSEGSSTAVYPYCKETLDKAPKKKKKCPHCGDYIYVRSSQELYPSKHLTYEEAIATDEFYYLKEYEVTKQSFDNKLEQLTGTSDKTVSPLDVCVALYDDLILQTTDTLRLEVLYLRNALIKHRSGSDFFTDLQNSAKMELLRYEQGGAQKVTIRSTDACEECQQLNGRVLTIREALMERPIPCKKCIHDKNEKGEGVVSVQI